MDMSDNAWIFVADRETWPVCASEGSFGLKRAPGRIKDARVGDSCVAYVTRDCAFAGFGKITSPYYYDESEIWLDEIFPHRLSIDIKLDIDRTVDIRPLINGLDFIKDKKYWSVFLRGGAIRIPLADFEFISTKLEERWQAKEPELPLSESKNLREVILSLPELDGTLHDRLAQMIHLVGQEMGYGSVERLKTHPQSPYQIDVCWLQRKNPRIAVEIHDAGNLLEALDRLRHAREFNFGKVVLVIVEPTDLIRCLNILRFDDKLKHWIDLWSMKSVYDMYTNCMAFQQLYRRFEESTYKDQMQDQLF
jgi:hypothetical protein